MIIKINKQKVPSTSRLRDGRVAACHQHVAEGSSGSKAEAGGIGTLWVGISHGRGGCALGKATLAWHQIYRRAAALKDGHIMTPSLQPAKTQRCEAGANPKEG